MLNLKTRISGLDCVRRQLEAVAGPLPADIRVVLEGLNGVDVRRRGDVLPPRDGYEFLLSGWACRQRILEDGRVQAFALFLPGDVLTHGHKGQSHFRTVALTDLVVQDASAILDLRQGARSALAFSVGRSLELAEMRLYDHLVRLGRRDAYAGLMDLFQELHERLSAVGLAEGYRFPFPIGQEKLGDMMGLSGVHVNRTLRQMKANGDLLSGPGWYALPRFSLGSQ